MKHARLDQSGARSTAGCTMMLAGTDAAFCFICMKTETEKKFKSSTKREATFISKRIYELHAKHLKSTPTVNVIRKLLKALGYL